MRARKAKQLARRAPIVFPKPRNIDALTVIVPEHGLVLTVGEALTPDRDLTCAVGDEHHVQLHA